MARKTRPKEDLPAYLAARAKKNYADLRIGDRSGVTRIGAMFGVSAETVRDELYRQGWRREALEASGLEFWVYPGRKWGYTKKKTRCSC